MPIMKVENVKGDRFDLSLESVFGGGIIRVTDISIEDIEQLVEKGRNTKETLIEDPVALQRIEGSKLVRLLARGVFYLVDPAKLQKELDNATGARCRAYAPQDDGSHIQCAMSAGHGGDHSFDYDDPFDQLIVATSSPSIPALAPSRHPETELL